ncbi:uncharacterized protein [Choristoneura fumiferana]|uniref:uncharacterized protein n=1 Tax=Choristoneura fumiferana TaxID=7141 RepID=UPI003D15BC29
METATKKKKPGGLKGKLKKTIKNVLCRPDPILWPVVSEENENTLRMALEKYKVDIPVFTKPHWKELKQIPKEERPKQPKLPKRDGLIFGVAQCCEAVKNTDCSAVLIESEVNPRFIIQPIIEACTSANVPIICLKNLRSTSLCNFGIKTICLGIQRNYLQELTNTITELLESYQTPIIKRNETLEEMEVETALKTNIPLRSENNTVLANLLLFRKDKKTRVFVPPSENASIEAKKQFVGQDFIEFSGKSTKLEQNDVTFKKMILKRIANNPNRPKAGKKRKN